MASTTKNEEATSVVNENSVTIAAGTTTNAKKTAQLQSDRELRAASERRLKLADTYRKEKKVAVSIAPAYAARLGRVANIIVNGCSVCVPCDGRTYEIPETFAASLKRKLRNVDILEARGKALSNIANNVESFAGQLRF